MNRTDKLNAWEKAAIFTTGAGGAFNILLYQLGYALADAAPANPWLWFARVFFAVVSFVGFDLTLGVTVMAMRAGRRSLWAGLTVAASLLAASGIALDVSAVWQQPWMHAAPPAVLAAFMLHLAAPPMDQRPRALAQRAEQAEADVAQLRLELDLRDETIGALRRDVETARDLVAQHADQHGIDVAQLQAELRQARAALASAAHRQIEDGAERITVNGRSVSLRRLAEISGAPLTTLRRRLAQEE